MVDKGIKKNFNNLSKIAFIQNQIWNANIKLHVLGYHKAKGSLKLNYVTARFDPAQGIAVFKNLAISEKGMYLLKFTVNTIDDEYNFDCFSKAITVKDETQKAAEYSTEYAPNYILKFEGDYDQIEPEEVKANVYNYISQYNIRFGGLQIHKGSVYVSFYSSDSDSNLVNDLNSGGLTIDPKLTFVYANIDNSILSCTNCQVAVSLF